VHPSEGKLYRHLKLYLFGVAVCHLGVESPAIIEVYNTQDDRRIEAGPQVVLAIGEQFASSISKANLLELVLALAVHANPLWREVDIAADQTLAATAIDVPSAVAPRNSSSRLIFPESISLQDTAVAQVFVVTHQRQL
jgi:hypothetical protein